MLWKECCFRISVDLKKKLLLSTKKSCHWCFPPVYHCIDSYSWCFNDVHWIHGLSWVANFTCFPINSTVSHWWFSSVFYPIHGLHSFPAVTWHEKGRLTSFFMTGWAVQETFHPPLSQKDLENHTTHVANLVSFAAQNISSWSGLSVYFSWWYWMQ